MAEAEDTTKEEAGMVMEVAMAALAAAAGRSMAATGPIGGIEGALRRSPARKGESVPSERYPKVISSRLPKEASPPSTPNRS